MRIWELVNTIQKKDRVTCQKKYPDKIHTSPLYFSPKGKNYTQWHTVKGKLGDFFYWLKVFIGPKLGQVSKGNFHREAPKWVKNQVKG